MKWAAWLFVLAGCGVAPGPGDAGGDNAPPRIATRTPDDVRVLYERPRCRTAPSFSLLVEDEDVEQTLRARWFLEEASGSVGFDTVIPPSGTATRVVSAPSTDAFAVALDNLARGSRLLTVYVTDADSFDERVPPRAVGDGFVVQAVWLLDVLDCP